MAATYLDILHTYWGYPSFRGIQADIIESIGAGRDTLGLMPTGGGKSLTFQVPALAKEGVCVVITPLIALMKDQVAALRQRNIIAAALYAGMDREEILTTLDNCILGRTKLLYVSPERLSSDIFRTKLRHMRVSFITVDEAHCISQWGYDFRPAYLSIAAIRHDLPGVPVLALTATATPQVVDDIQAKLEFARPCVFRMSFARNNLSYNVLQVDDKEQELLRILKQTRGSAIVYTRNRQRTREITDLINTHGDGSTAVYYHAGLTSIDKDVRQQAWHEGDRRVMVATNAFGMGIDKPDVRWVFHMDMPDSLEAYFQEAGRAGRDGQAAYAILLYNRRDRAKMKQRVADQFPDKAFVRQIYEELGYFLQMALGDGFQVTREFDLNKFCTQYKHFPVPVQSALTLLSRAGYIDYRDEEDAHSRLMFITGRDELYRLQRMGPRADLLIQTLLRQYSGLFSQYVTIEEKRLEQLTGISAHDIYELLKSLTYQRILHYIPAKKIPRITYLMRRVESRHVVLGPDVYDKRKEQYIQRTEAMLCYAEETSRCRSQMLLSYFGEETSAPCGRCDVCRHRQEHPRPLAELEAFILQQLSPTVPVPPTQLLVRGDRQRFDEALRRLAEEGRVEMTPAGLLRR